MSIRILSRVAATLSVLSILLVSCGDSAETPMSDAVSDAVSDTGSDTMTETGQEMIEVETPLPGRSPGAAYHEHALSELPDQVRLNMDDTVAVWLEHPLTSVEPLHDTGNQPGSDVLPFTYFYAHEHAFCWNEAPDSDPHQMVLHDSEGNEILRIEEGEGCRTVWLEPGDYTQTFIHSGTGETSGELVFLRPLRMGEDKARNWSKTDSAPRTSTGPCKPQRTLTVATVNQLKPGEIGIVDSCSPASGQTVYVYDSECPDLTATPPAASFSMKGIYTGKDTKAIAFSGSLFTGWSVLSKDPGTTLTCVEGAVFNNDLHWDMRRSFKVWQNPPDQRAAQCDITWVGNASDLPRSGPPEGEVWLFTEKGRTGAAFRLLGPCRDLCNFNASEAISSAWIGNNTVMTIYADPDYFGESFSFQHIVDDFYQYDNLSKSVYVESLTAYNNETTLISKNNCDRCYLADMRLLENENLSGASLIQADLTGARMVGVDLSNANASGAIFRGANLAYANLKNATLSNAIFEGDDHSLPADLSYAYMPNAKLDSAHLNGVTANYAQIYGSDATVLQATLQGIKLANATLSGMDFAQAALKGATLTGANLINCRFNGADLTGADLVNASLQGTVFDGAILYGARLQNATVAFEAGSLQVTRLGDDNTLVVVTASFDATSLPPETTNATTFCPYGGQSDDGNDWCDSVEELTAPSPPDPPICIPSPTEFCERTRK